MSNFLELFQISLLANQMSINLLPQTQKTALRQEEIWRKIFLLSTFVLLALVLLILLTYGIKVYLFSRIRYLENSLEMERKELETAKFREIHQTITAGNERLAEIYKFWQQQVFLLPLFKNFSSANLDSIYFTGLSLKNKENVIEVKITGFAKTREELYRFKTELEKEKNFKNIYFLPSSWVKSQDVDFSFSLKYAQ